MEADFESRVRSLIEALDLARFEDILSITPLTGGVSSEIAQVALPGRDICVKFSLAQLKVEAEWHAPVRRNLAEYRWLEYAGDIAPDNVPELLGHDEALGGFAMECVTGEDVVNWKAELLENAPQMADVIAAARLLGQIHQHSASDKSVAQKFANQEDFHALRIEPYLESLLAKHSDLAEPIADMANSLGEARIALIHGDVSPKNILIRDGVPILLDAECATIGDPVFDVAFCLNHFLLKGVHRPENANAFGEAVHKFLNAYAPFITWETTESFEARLARLLPMLFLARVDGKSPVEYLKPQQQSDVRRIARAAISQQANTITPLVEAMMQETA